MISALSVRCLKVIPSRGCFGINHFLLQAAWHISWAKDFIRRFLCAEISCSFSLWQLEIGTLVGHVVERLNHSGENLLQPWQCCRLMLGSLDQSGDNQCYFFQLSGLWGSKFKCCLNYLTLGKKGWVHQHTFVIRLLKLHFQPQKCS